MRKSLVMLLALTVTSVVLCSVGLAGNSRYEKLRIRSLARENFDNEGRSRYLYVDKPVQTETYDKQKHTSEVGRIEIEKGSRVRKLNVVLDLDKVQKEHDRYSASRSHYRKTTKIGVISGDERTLQRIDHTIIIDSDHQIGK